MTGKGEGAAPRGGSGDPAAAGAIRTVVLIDGCSGVQVSDGNTQYNKFQVRVASVTIRAVQVGPAAASPAAVSELCLHPSRAAAEAVARQIADAAR